MLRARGKGSKERIVPVGRAGGRGAARHICSADARRSSACRVESQLFVNHRGGGR